MYTKNIPESYLAVVLWFNRDKGYGYAKIAYEERDVMIHQSIINMDGFRKVDEDQIIEICGIQETPEGLRALEVNIIA